MNAAWAQFRDASKATGNWINRKAMRDLLRKEPELRTVRQGTFGAWRSR